MCQCFLQGNTAHVNFTNHFPNPEFNYNLAGNLFYEHDWGNYCGVVGVAVIFPHYTLDFQLKDKDIRMIRQYPKQCESLSAALFCTLKKYSGAISALQAPAHLHHSGSKGKGTSRRSRDRRSSQCRRAETHSCCPTALWEGWLLVDGQARTG